MISRTVGAEDLRTCVVRHGCAVPNPVEGGPPPPRIRHGAAVPYKWHRQAAFCECAAEGGATTFAYHSRAECPFSINSSARSLSTCWSPKLRKKDISSRKRWA